MVVEFLKGGDMVIPYKPFHTTHTPTTKTYHYLGRRELNPLGHVANPHHGRPNQTQSPTFNATNQPQIMYLPLQRLTKKCIDIPNFGYQTKQRAQKNVTHGFCGEAGFDPPTSP